MPLLRLPPPLDALAPESHVLVVGKTGSGKSTLLRALLHREGVMGRGAVLLDPHGDLAADVLADLPRFRKNDLVLLDPTRPDCRALNPLRRLDRENRHLGVASIVSAVRKLFPESAWGARTEHLLRNALLAAAEVRGGTLADAARILTDEAHRAWMLRQVKDPGTLAFWTGEFAGYGRSFAAEATAAPANKLGALLASPQVRDVLTKSRPRLDLGRALDRHGFVVARLSKGELGEEPSRFLGGVLLGLVQAALYARVATPVRARAPVKVVVDEAGSFPANVLLELLAEGRKFGASIVVATQGLAALPPEVRAGLLANAGTIVAFRVGGEDAELLGREFGNEFGPASLTALSFGEVVVRVGGAPARPAALT